jgi:hypothetical protein
MEHQVLTRLADDPLLVSSAPRIRSRLDREVVSRFLRQDSADERVACVRQAMLPRLRLWAVRRAWDDAQTGPERFRLSSHGTLRLGDPLTLDVADFGQWFHQRAMHHVDTLLVALAQRWPQVELVLRVSAPASARELRLLRVLLDGPASRQMAAMLGTTRGALRTRLWRDTAGIGRDPTNSRS